MTVEEMHSKIEEYIAEEEADADKYEQLASTHPDYHCIFRDMAHEERSHAKLLRHILSHAK